MWLYCCPRIFVEKTFPSPAEWSWPFCWKSVDHRHNSLFLGAQLYSIDWHNDFCPNTALSPLSLLCYNLWYWKVFILLALTLTHVWLFATPWTLAPQAPLSMRFSRREYWSGLPFSSPGIFLIKGSNPSVSCLLHWQLDSLPVLPTGKPSVLLVCSFFSR